MLSYLHQYHAGNFADLHKQLLLTEILGNLTEKNKPFTMMDTHGGEGYYLFSSKLSKNYRELQSGLAPFFNQLELFKQDSKTPELLKKYARLLQNWNPNNSLEIIPGSPLLLSHYLRNDSKLIVCEKHPSVFAKLETNFLSKNSNITLSQNNGYQLTKACLPPKEKRGVIFIDPSYEEKSEYEQLADCITHAIKRFSTGIYVIWYPILNNRPKDAIDWLIRKILALPIRALWQHEWYLESGLTRETSGFHALQGSGLLCLNLPWQADQNLNLSMDWLNTRLFPGRKVKHIWLKQPD
jgi:23S rRNA (adenine2030-N6)-methyltransferase